MRGAVRRAVAGTKADAAKAAQVLSDIGPEVDDAALSAVESLLATADPRFWTALEGVRERLLPVAPGDAPRSQPAATDTVPCLCVKALFPDGRVREQAVDLLAVSASRAALPVLGLRTADWAAPVREAAREAVARLLDEDVDGTALAALAPMALHLARRLQGRWLAEQTLRRLTGPGSERVLAQLLTSPHTPLRRATYQALADSGGLDLSRAVQAAVHDRDTVIRRRCAEAARRLAVRPQDAPFMRQMLASSTPLVRAEALDALNRLGEQDALHTALSDRSGLVRGTARFHLRSRGIDFAAVYRDLVADAGTVTPGAVAGLAEVGSPADAELVRPLLRHPGVRVRTEAIRALIRLAPKVDAEDLLRLITDGQSPAVLKQATRALFLRGPAIAPERLLELLDPAHTAPVRLAARQLLAFRDSSWRITVDVMLLADPEPAVAAQAMRDLAAAMQEQIYTNPRGKAAELLAVHLPDADRLLPRRTAALLRFILGMPLEAAARSAEPDEELLEPVHQARATAPKFRLFRFRKREAGKAAE